MPDALPVVSAPLRYQGLPRRLRRRPSGCWRTSSSATASCTPGRSTAAGRSRTRPAPPGEFDLLVVGNGHHWDARLPDFPGDVHRRDHPLAPLHRSADAARTDRQADPGRRHRQQRRRHHRRAVVEDRCRTRSRCRPAPARGSCRSTLRDSRVTSSSRPRRTCRCRGSARPRSCSHRWSGADPTHYGLPPANHKLFEAHPTQSVELPLRLGSGDVIPKPNVTRLDGDTVHFDDGTSDVFDAIVYATGYNITFPFFDPDFISAPDNQIRLYKRMFKPGIDNLVFIGFAQAIPTLFPFVECQARLLAAYAVGRYALPSVGRDGATSSTPTSSSTPATASTDPGTPSRSTTSTTSTTSAPRSCRPARNARPRRQPVADAGMRSRTDRRPPQRSDTAPGCHPRRAGNLPCRKRLSTTSTSPISPSRPA